MLSENPVLNTLIKTTSLPMREAIHYCATPYWFQKTLAVKIIENFVQTNDYSAQDLFYQLLDLPFIYSHDEVTWQYTDDARNKILASLAAEDKSKYKAVHALVANEINDQLKTLFVEGCADLSEGDQQTDFNSWQVRRLRWQLIYYLAPVDPEKAYKEFQIISEWAKIHKDRLPMYKLAVEAWEKQARWLNTYREEGAYYLGYFAYKVNDLARAESLFSSVWFGSIKNIFMKTDAGHLLGVIYRQKGQTRWTEKAEEILRLSLSGLENDEGEDNLELVALKARILNSLAATLIQTSDYVEMSKAQKKLKEAEILLKECLRFEKDVLKDNYGMTHLYNTLSKLYLQYEKRLNLGKVYLIRAIEYIDEALFLSQDGNEPDIIVHYNTKAEVLIELGDENNLNEAEELLRKCLKSNKKIRDQRTQAISSTAMGELYIKRGDEKALRSSIKWLYQGLEAWKELGHAFGQKKCMENMAIAYDQLNEPEKTSLWHSRAFLIK